MTRETIRVRGKGEITLPVDIRQKLGLEAGSLLTAELTAEGVLLKPAEVVAREAMVQIAKELKAHGVTLEDLMKAGRRARARTAARKYGAAKSPKSHRKRS
ncbi:MAG: AbrB/MazE/SpoVT family DNA-binding domain-containing protein [Anaerolineae bacterium]|nr:AbrB/MazE/SpoVT family DNA-binding domain-containing protein [Candidatus Roseilinea sp.]MDW8451374.1 AbrB/MazE/SpoVT family DNA-binding domain-containing protein [Anaerolineae bacterium]